MIKRYMFHDLFHGYAQDEYCPREWRVLSRVPHTRIAGLSHYPCSRYF